MVSVSLKTVIIKTEHLQTLSDFYQQSLHLGFPTHQDLTHIGFQLPNLYFGFDRVTEEKIRYPGAHSIWFEVENIEQTFEELLQLNATIKMKPQKKPWGDIIAAVLDLDGNILGLSQQKTKEPSYKRGNFNS